MGDEALFLGRRIDELIHYAAERPMIVWKVGGNLGRQLPLEANVVLRLPVFQDDLRL